MAVQTILCPHCRAKKSLSSCAHQEIARNQGYLFYICDFCHRPIIHLIQQHKASVDYRSVWDVQCANVSVEKCDWQVLDSWPKPEFHQEEVPGGLPDSIKNMFVHSQRAALSGGYDLSILGFLLVLKMAQSAHSPEFKGNVRSWILSLIAQGFLVAGAKKWVNRLKLCGEVVGADALIAEDYAAFVHIVLDQLFALDARMNALRGARKS